MSENRLPDYLDHIRQAASDAFSFVEGMDKVDFLADKRTQSAVVMCLIIIGEAAVNVMDRHPDFAGSHPEIHWRDMRGMRNRIAQGYIDLDMVWDTTRSQLPDLITHLTGICEGG